MQPLQNLPKIHPIVPNPPLLICSKRIKNIHLSLDLLPMELLFSKINLFEKRQDEHHEDSHDIQVLPDAKQRHQVPSLNVHLQCVNTVTVISQRIRQWCNLKLSSLADKRSISHLFIPSSQNIVAWKSPARVAKGPVEPIHPISQDESNLVIRWRHLSPTFMEPTIFPMLVSPKSSLIFWISMWVKEVSPIFSNECIWK